MKPSASRKLLVNSFFYRKFVAIFIVKRFGKRFHRGFMKRGRFREHTVVGGFDSQVVPSAFTIFFKLLA